MGQGGHTLPDFGRTVNPLSTRVGGELCLPHYYLPLRIFRPSYGPASCYWKIIRGLDLLLHILPDSYDKTSLQGGFFWILSSSLSPSTLSWEWAMSTTLKKVSEWITEDHGILGHRLRSVIDSLLWHSNAMGNLDGNSRRTSVNSTMKHLCLLCNTLRNKNKNNKIIFWYIGNI